MPVATLDTLIESSATGASKRPNNEVTFDALTAAYVYLGFGVPTIEGYTSLINNANSTNFGAGNNGVVFNQENVFLNAMASLYKFNPTAHASFDAIVAGGATLQDQLNLVYDSIVPAGAQSDAGRAYFQSQAGFYAARAAELGLTGNGAALIGAAALINIAVTSDIAGIGDAINDLRAAIDNGTAVIPETGAAFTPIETADGAQFDGDDSNSSQGQSFTLTNNIDGPGGVAPAADTQGTAQNDTYTGVLGTTLTTGDSINGQGGIDTLRVIANGNSNQLPLLSNVEVIETSNFGAAGTNAQLNLASTTGVTTLISSNGGVGVTYNNVAAIAEAQVNNTTSGSLTINYNAATVAGAADVQKVVLNNANITSGVTINGIETLDVTSTGTNVLNALASDKLSTVNVVGGGSLTVASALTGATTIDASTTTGTVSVLIDAAKDVTYKGGTGIDIVGSGGALNALDKLDGGAGTADVIRFTAEEFAPAAKLTTAVNFEGVQIDLANAGGTINVDNFSGSSITSFKYGNNAADVSGITGGTQAITNAVTGSSITVDVNATDGAAGAITFALKTDGAADAVTLNLVDTDTDAGNDAGGLASFTAATVESLTINTSMATIAGATITDDTLVINTLSANAATTLKIAGTEAISLGTTASTLGALTSVDASTMTKSVTLGDAADAFNTALTGADIKTGSANDQVSLSVGAGGGVLKSIDLGTQSTTIGSQGDLLILSGGAVANVNTIVDLTAADQISTLLGSVNVAAQTGIESVNLINLSGNATITGTSAINNIIGTALNDSISAGAGADIIRGAGGVDVQTGGTGADTFNVGVTEATASTNFGGTVTPVAGNTVVSDAILDFTAGDTINLFGRAGNVAADAGAVGTLEADEYLLVRGNYDAASNTFTVNAAGTSTALTYDGSGGAGVQQETIVLAGVLPAEVTYANNVFSHV